MHSSHSRGHIYKNFPGVHVLILPEKQCGKQGVWNFNLLAVHNLKDFSRKLETKRYPKRVFVVIVNFKLTGFIQNVFNYFPCAPVLTRILLPVLFMLLHGLHHSILCLFVDDQVPEKRDLVLATFS